MFTPYDPCKDCKQSKSICSKCSYKTLKKEYRRALTRIIELSRELGHKITILV